MQSREEVQAIPLQIVGGNEFGRYNKTNASQTFNMIISDNTLVDYAGFNFEAVIGNGNVVGRGLHTSTIGNFMVAVVGSQVFRIGTDLVPHYIPGGNLATDSGEVSIAENNMSQIALTDNLNIYIYDYNANTFVTVPLTYSPAIAPGYITYQNTYFIVVDTITNQWFLSEQNDGTTWPVDEQHQGLLSTKPDLCQAAIPFPGKGNQLFLFGHTVAESWVFTAAALFPYQKTSSFNVDYGCLNPSSIAFQGEFIVWLGISEEAGPVVMYSTGGDIHEISTDGIDYKLSQLTNPEDCSGFLVKLDGHLIYHFTFRTDNLTYLYDFTTKKFFTATDENLNYHPARKIVFFNNDYYFVSFNDGNLYRFGTQYSSYNYPNNQIEEIPRIRVCPPIRLPSQDWFVVRDLSFTVENGQPNFFTTISDVTYSNMAIDLSLSRDGGEDFGSSARFDMMPTGHRKSKIIYYRLGQANDLTVQLRFNGFSRYVVFDGFCNAYV